MHGLGRGDDQVALLEVQLGLVLQVRLIVIRDVDVERNALFLLSIANLVPHQRQQNNLWAT